MAKRKLSNQQRRRINKNQKNKIIEEQLDTTDTQVARVVSHHGKQLMAETEQLDRIKCKIRQNLGDIACGDYILIKKNILPSGVTQHVVVAVKPRKNLLRKTGFNDTIKLVAANISQLLIVTSIKPKPNPYLIDRYLVAAENLPAQAIIVINKMDLLNKDDPDGASQNDIDDLTKLYQSIGYRVICYSTKVPQGWQELADALDNNTSILVGLSGVGKSSIVKNILPEKSIKVAETSKSTGEGKHTTTVSALYHFGKNAVVIDSPGVRDFTPSHSEIDEISQGFVDIKKFVGLCKFSTCHHQTEPHCALKSAVENKQLSVVRFNNYLRMLEGISSIN